MVRQSGDGCVSQDVYSKTIMRQSHESICVQQSMVKTQAKCRVSQDLHNEDITDITDRISVVDFHVFHQ